MKHHKSKLLAAALLLISASACDDSDDNDSTNDESKVEEGDAGRTVDAGRDAGRSDDDDGGSGGADGGLDAGQSGDGGAADAQADAAADLTDPQIAAVTTTANEGEVLQANTARPKLTNPNAQAFADMMVTMHTAAQNRQSALLMQKGITPEPNEVSTMLKQESDAIVAQLSAAPAPVDLPYMEAQVTVHQKVLNLLDTVLIPSAEDAALKADLMTARGEVSAHLTMAMTIRSQLAAAGDGGT